MPTLLGKLIFKSHGPGLLEHLEGCAWTKPWVRSCFCLVLPMYKHISVPSLGLYLFLNSWLNKLDQKLSEAFNESLFFVWDDETFLSPLKKTLTFSFLFFPPIPFLGSLQSPMLYTKICLHQNKFRMKDHESGCAQEPSMAVQTPYATYELGIPQRGWWRELLLEALRDFFTELSWVGGVKETIAPLGCGLRHKLCRS